MLSQLEFKLSVEKQYKNGIEKMVRLYQDEGDRKSRADAEGRRIESSQKVQLLRQALKRYEDLHVDMDSSADVPDGTWYTTYEGTLTDHCRREFERSQHPKAADRSFVNASSCGKRRRSRSFEPIF